MYIVNVYVMKKVVWLLGFLRKLECGFANHWTAFNKIDKPSYHRQKNVSKFIVNLYLNLTPSLCVQFHKDCIDSWLLHSHPTCPVDGQVVWDPVTAQLEAEEEAERTSQR